MSKTSAAPPVVVAGAGFGARIHVPALRAAGFDVVGLVGTNATRTAERAQKAGVARSFTDLDEAIARTGAVAATIATPPNTHAPLTLAALSRGCHVICEKPFAWDAAEARTLLAAAEKAGVVHLLGTEFRWTPERAMAARVIADGMIGEPGFLTLVRYLPTIASPDAAKSDWWLAKEAGGGWLGTQSPHMIDMVRVWLGEFASLSAALPTVSVHKGGAEDAFVVRFGLANGVEGIFQTTTGAWGPVVTMLRVAGTQGTIWLDGANVWLADKDGPRQLPIDADLMTPPPPPEVDINHRTTPVEIGPYMRLCEAFRARVDGREPETRVPLPTFADGVASMEVIDAIRASAAQGGALMQVGGRRP